MSDARARKRALLEERIGAIEAELRRRIKASQPARCRASLIDFAKAMFPDPAHPDDASASTYEATKFHKVVAASLQQVDEGNWPRLVISTQPRAGKSQLASKLFPAWALGNDPTKSIAVVTYSEQLATEFGAEIRQFIESPRYREIFPKLKLKARNTAAATILTDQGGGIRCVGRSGSLTGRGFHVIVIDDLFRDDAEARSRTIRENLWNWYTRTLSTRLMPGKGGGLVMVGTRWHSDDVLGRLTDPASAFYTEREAKRWRYINLPAIAEENDPLGRKPGEALWPERYPIEWLENQRNLDPVAFRCLYLGKPTADEGELFQDEHLKTYEPEEMPKDLAYCVACDFAISTKNAADYSALMIVGVDASGTWWVHPDSSLVKASSDALVERLVNLCQKHPVHVVYAEKGHISHAIGPFLRQRMKETQTHVPIMELQPTGDKVMRAQSLLGRCATGRVMWPAKAQWWLQVRDEFLRFPRGANDDVVDALSLLSMHQAYLRRGKADGRDVANTPAKDDAGSTLTLDMLRRQESDRKRAAARNAKRRIQWV